MIGSSVRTRRQFQSFLSKTPPLVYPTDEPHCDCNDSQPSDSASEDRVPHIVQPHLLPIPTQLALAFDWRHTWIPSSCRLPEWLALRLSQVKPFFFPLQSPSTRTDRLLLLFFRDVFETRATCRGSRIIGGVKTENCTAAMKDINTVAARNCVQSKAMVRLLSSPPIPSTRLRF